MEAFHDVVFPESIAYGATGGPEFTTQVTMGVNGYEQRLVRWQQPKLRYNIRTGVQTAEHMRELLDFFRARMGRAFGFRFHDWMDDRATGAFLGEGDGETTRFQLRKYYQSGNALHTRDIRLPITETVAIYADGVLLTAGYQVSGLTGEVSFTAAPAHGVVLSADFHFHVPVRFDVDRLEMTLVHYQRYQWQKMELVEIRY